MDEIDLKQLIKGFREKTHLLVFIVGFLSVILLATNILIISMNKRISQGRISDQAVSTQVDEIKNFEIFGQNSVPNYYIVKVNDSLWKIADQELLDSYRWMEIYQLNNQIIGKNPDLIFPNTKLLLPRL
ncbi:MAG: LysM peptidoglycan-binding domain-containing protein [Pseudomonadales bacterium]|nr:LysM peptidoglycan-binding domain-containing protein [Pseudomonadales bacterium]